MAVRRGRPQTPAAMSTARSTRAQDDRPDPRAGALRRRHHVVETGRIGGPPMVFAHGYATNQGVWRHVAPAFEDDYHVVRFDHVGSGRSDRGAWDPERHGSLDGYADDVVDLIDGLGLAPVVLVGHSVSGIIGALAVARAPERFARLIMVGPSARFIDDEGYVGGGTREQIEAVLHDIDHDFAGWARAMAPALVGDAPPGVAEELEGLMRSNDGAPGASGMARAFLLADHRADLERVRVPALVMQASKDPFVPVEVGRYIESRLPHSEFVQLAATGHFPSLSAPAEVVAAIRAFL